MENVYIILNNLIQGVLSVFILTSGIKKRESYTLRLLIFASIFVGLGYLSLRAELPLYMTGVFYIAEAALLVAEAAFCYYISPIMALIIGVSAYTANHIAFDLFALAYSAVPFGSLHLNYLVMFAIYALLYLLLYVFIRTHRQRFVGEIEYSVKWIVLAIAVLLFCIILNLISLSYPEATRKNLCFTYDIIGSLLALVIIFYISVSDRQKTELKKMRELWEKNKRYYEFAKVNIDALNHKCHDLKHQLAAISSGSEQAMAGRVKTELAETIKNYDIIPKTKNEALNAILLEKCLQCRKSGITLNYMCDGGHLDFIDTLDLYVILGNALDNAIESTAHLASDQRIVNLIIEAKNNLLFIKTINYFAGELTFKNNMPVTTKADKASHGYGMKSIRLLTQKYGGNLSVNATDSIFNLTLMIPIP